MFRTIAIFISAHSQNNLAIRRVLALCEYFQLQTYKNDASRKKKESAQASEQVSALAAQSNFIQQLIHLDGKYVLVVFWFFRQQCFA